MPMISLRRVAGLPWHDGPAPARPRGGGAAVASCVLVRFLKYVIEKTVVGPFWHSLASMGLVLWPFHSFSLQAAEYR